MAKRIGLDEPVFETPAAPWESFTKLKQKASLENWQKAAGMDWSCVQTPLLYKSTQTGKTIEDPGKCVLVRDDNDFVLSVVSKRYKPVQPSQIMEFFKDLVDELEIFKMETAGVLRGGRKIWAIAKADDPIVIADDDQIERKLLLATSFDQSIPTIVKQTSVRLVCKNMLDALLTNDEGSVSVRHITQFKSDAAKRRAFLDQQWGSFSKLLKKLTKQQVTDYAAQQFFMDVLYTEKYRSSKEFSEKGAERRVNELISIYKHAPGQQTKAAQNTAYGLVNAITFYSDHASKTKNDDIRLDKNWFGDGLALKRRAVELAHRIAS